MTELDPASKQLLAQMMAGAEMPDDRHDEILRDVEHSIAQDLPPRIGEGPMGPAPTGRRRIGVLAVAGGALAAAGLVAGLALSQAGVWSSSEGDDRSAQSAEMIDQRDDEGGRAEIRDPKPTRPPTAPSDDPEEPDLVIEDDAEPPEPPVKSRRSKRPTPAVDPREEMALLLKARQDVNAGRYAAALSSIRKHARSYPKSSFAQERRLLEVKAHCGAGHLEKAKALITRHAKSTPAVRTACPAAE